MAWLDVLKHQCHTMAVDPIVRQHQDSFAIANHQIPRVRQRHNSDRESGQSNDELTLQRDDGKLRSWLLQGDLRQVKKLARQAGPA